MKQFCVISLHLYQRELIKKEIAFKTVSSFDVFKENLFQQNLIFNRFYSDKKIINENNAQILNKKSKRKLPYKKK